MAVFRSLVRVLLCAAPMLLRANPSASAQSAAALGEPVPREMLGLWAKDGNCGSVRDHMRGTAASVKSGRHKPQAIVYYPNDDWLGRGTGHCSQEEAGRKT